MTNGWRPPPSPNDSTDVPTEADIAAQAQSLADRWNNQYIHGKALMVKQSDTSVVAFARYTHIESYQASIYHGIDSSEWIYVEYVVDSGATC